LATAIEQALRGNTHSEKLLDLAKSVDAGLELEVVVRRGLGDGRNDGDVVSLGADIVGRRDHGDVNVCGMLLVQETPPTRVE
jgi:hypothetical protein